MSKARPKANRSRDSKGVTAYSGGAITDKTFPVVGIGASAGGVEPFKRLLADLPLETGMAFVLVQHLDPKHESLSLEVFSKVTRMQVLEVKQGMRLEPNH